MEYGSPAWSPWHLKDIRALEKVQERCLGLIKGEKPEIESLENRRRKADLLETFKMLRGYYKNDSQRFFSFSNRVTRGHSYKLLKKHVRTDIRKYYFTNRVVNDWNNLPEEVVSVKNLATFKGQLRSLPLDRRD